MEICDLEGNNLAQLSGEKYNTPCPITVLILKLLIKNYVRQHNGS